MLKQCRNLTEKLSERISPYNGGSAFKHVKQPPERHNISKNACTEAYYGVDPHVITEKFGKFAYRHSREYKKRRVAYKNGSAKPQHKPNYTQSFIDKSKNKSREKRDHKAIGNRNVHF